MNDKTTSDAQVRATNNYRNKALANVTFVISERENDVFEALQAIQAHYGDKRAKAIKEAILAHAKQLGL